jgi:hypothetical protein
MFPGSVEARANTKMTFRQAPLSSLSVVCLFSSETETPNVRPAMTIATEGSLMIDMTGVEDWKVTRRWD